MAIRTSADTAAAAIGAVGLLDVLRGMLRRRKKVIFISTVLFAALGYLVIAVSSPVYTAVSRVIIEYEDLPYTRAGTSVATGAPRQVTDRDVRSQVEVIRSRNLALKVLRKLGLLGTAEFDPLKKGIGPLKQMKITLGFIPDPRQQTPEQRALMVWEKHLKVYSLPNTKVIVIEFSASSPQTAAAVANALAEAYVEQTRSARLARTGEAREWLKQQIEKLRAKVVEAEKAVEVYRARAGLFQGTQTKLHNQELSELSAQIVRAAAERSQAEAKAKAIRRLLKKGDVEKSADVLRSPLIQRLREQQVQIRRRLAELSTIYLDNHPRVKAVRKELADLKRQIRNEARKIAESLEEQARIAAAREAELRARQAKMKAQVSAASQDEVKLRELEREAKAQRSLLESFLARYTDALTRDDKQALPGMARVIGRAWAPASPSFPKPGPIMLLATLAGLVLGLGLAFILEVMAAVQQSEQAGHVAYGDDRAAPQARFHEAAPPEPGHHMNEKAGGRQPDLASTSLANGATDANAALAADHAAERRERSGRPQTQEIAVATQTGTERAANVEPTMDNGRHGEPVPVHPARHKGQKAEAANQDAGASPASAVEHKVLRWMDEANARRIALAVLGIDGEETARVVLQAARRLSAGNRVILLDTAEDDYRLLPGGSHDGDHDNSPGLTDLLSGNARFAEVVQRDGAARQLHVVPAGNKRVGSEKMLHGEAMQRLLQALQDNYDLVLLYEGEPRFPLRSEDSALSLADAVIVLFENDFEGLAEGLCRALREKGMDKTAIISLDQDDAASRAAVAAARENGNDGNDLAAALARQA